MYFDYLAILFKWFYARKRTNSKGVYKAFKSIDPLMNINTTNDFSLNIYNIIHAWHSNVLNIFTACVLLSSIQYLVSGDTVQLVNRWDNDLKVAGSSTLCANIFLRTKFVFSMYLLNVGDPQSELHKNDGLKSIFVSDNIVIFNSAFVSYFKHQLFLRTKNSWTQQVDIETGKLILAIFVQFGQEKLTNIC